MPEKIKTNGLHPAYVSAEPWEIQAVHHEFPTRSEKELEPAIKKCKEQKADARNRRKLAECVAEKIRT